MRVMVMVKASPSSEAGEMPGQQLLADMGRFNEELVRAGVMLAGEGLHPTAKGVRVQFSGRQRTVVDGPFAETKEQLLGFYLIECEDLDAAIAAAQELAQASGSLGAFELRPVGLFHDWKAQPVLETE